MESFSTKLHQMRVRTIKSSAIPEAAKGQLLNSYIVDGMTREEVQAILGYPNDGLGRGWGKDRYSVETYWEYQVTVVFNYQNKVVLSNRRQD